MSVNTQGGEFRIEEDSLLVGREEVAELPDETRITLIRGDGYDPSEFTSRQPGRLVRMREMILQHTFDPILSFFVDGPFKVKIGAGAHNEDGR